MKPETGRKLKTKQNKATPFQRHKQQTATAGGGTDRKGIYKWYQTTVHSVLVTNQIKLATGTVMGEICGR